MKLQEFNMNDLLLFIVAVLGALGGLCLVIERSKCSSVCWGLCVRDVEAVIQSERININRQEQASAEPEAEQQ